MFINYMEPVSKIGGKKGASFLIINSWIYMHIKNSSEFICIHILFGF